MFEHSVESRAILLHKSRGSHAIEITTHSVIPQSSDHGKMYTLGAGQLFGPEQKEELSNLLANERKSESLTLIDSRVLAQTSYALVWWMPSHERTIRQKVEDDQVGGNQVVSLKLKVPSSIGIMCRGKLRVVAVKSKTQRPTAVTSIFRAPLANLVSDTSFCMGNIQISYDIDVANIDDWTDAIWSTTGSHMSRSPLKGVSTPEEYIDTLSSYANTPRFPTNRLVPLGATIGDLLDQLEVAV